MLIFISCTIQLFLYQDQSERKVNQVKVDPMDPTDRSDRPGPGVSYSALPRVISRHKHSLLKRATVC